MKTLTPMHFVHNYLINPTNPIKVNVIGAGGTGSYMILELSKLNLAMLKLGHPGLGMFVGRRYSNRIQYEPSTFC